MSEILKGTEGADFRAKTTEQAKPLESKGLDKLELDVANGLQNEIKTTRDLPLQRLAEKCRPAELVLLAALILGLAPKVDAKDASELVQTIQTISGTGGQSFSETQIGVFDAVGKVEKSKHWEAEQGEQSNMEQIKNFVEDVQQNLRNEGYQIGGVRLKVTEMVGVSAEGSLKHPKQSDQLNAKLLEERANQATNEDEANLAALGGIAGTEVVVRSEQKDAKLLIIKNADGSVGAENRDDYYNKIGVTAGQADKFFHWQQAHQKGNYRLLTSEQQRALSAIDAKAMREKITTGELSIDVGIEVLGEANHQEIEWSTQNTKIVIITDQNGNHELLVVAPLRDSDVEERPLVPKTTSTKRAQSPVIPVKKAVNTGSDFSTTRRGSFGSNAGGNIGGRRG